MIIPLIIGIATIGIIIVLYYTSNKKTSKNFTPMTKNSQSNEEQENSYTSIFINDKGYTSLEGIRHQKRGNILDFNLNEQVYLIPEPENKYDKNAIKVITAQGIKIGYISKFYNKEILELMQEGYQFITKISTINLDEPDYPYASLEIIKTKEKNAISLTNEELIELNNKSIEVVEKYKQDSKTSYELTKKGLEFEKDNKISEAIKYFEKAIQLPQTPPIAFKRLAVNYRKNKDYINEIRVLNKNIESVQNSKAYDYIKRDEIREIKKRIKKAKLLSQKEKT